MAWALVFGAAPPSDAAGFGRFGRLFDDGLLTVSVSPSGVATPPQVPGWRLTWAPVTDLRAVSLNPTAKTVSGRASATDGPDGWHATLLYPGLSVHFPVGTARLTLSGEGSPQWRLRRLPMAGLPDVVLVTREDRAAVPFALALDPGGTWTSVDLRDGVLVLRSQRPLGDVRVFTPTGIRTLDPGNPHARAETERLAAAWARRAIPVWTGRTAHASATGARVEFRDAFRVPFGEAWAPIPPVLGFAGAAGYPASIPEVVREARTETLIGPMVWQRGKVARWTLPVPDPGEMALVSAERRPEDAARRAELNRVPEDLLMTWARNAVDLGYSRSVPALLAFPYLEPPRQARLNGLMAGNFQRVWRMPGDPGVTEGDSPWRIEREPLTGEAYLWTYAISGEGPWRYDLEWGNALPIYGLAKAVAYAGRDDWARRHWRNVQRADRFMALGQDWAWMTTVNADHGYSTGTGDPMAAAYAGVLGLQRLARRVGDRPAEDRATARLALMAVPSVARLAYTPWARQRGLIGPRSVVVGFSELQGFTRGVLGQDPWDVTTLLSGNGAIPEFTDWLARTDPAGLDRYLQEYAAAYPRWWDRTVTYPFPCTYAGNSGYVVYPHILARMARGASEGDVNRWLDGVAGDTTHAWVGANVLGEALSRRVPVRLRGWKSGGYVGSRATGKVAELQFERVRAGQPWWLDVDVRPGADLAGATVNGRRVVLERLALGRWRVVARPDRGSLQVRLRWK